MRRWLPLALIALSLWLARPEAAIYLVHESFNTSNSNTIGPDLTWTETNGNPNIVSNKAMAGSLSSFDEARAEHPATSTDNWSQATMSSGTAWQGVSTRFDASDRTYYYFGTGGDAGHQEGKITKVVTGAITDLVFGTAVSTNGTVTTITARGTQINGFADGVWKVGATDSSITTGTRGGFSTFAETSLPTGGVDDFRHGDLPIQYAGAGTEAEAASGNLTLNMPASLRIHDLVLCAVHSSDQVSHSMGSEWTQVSQANGGGTTSRLSIWKARATQAGTFSSTTLSHSSGSGIIGGCVAFRSEKGIVDVDQVSTASTGTDGTIETNTVTPTQDFGVLLVVTGAADDNAYTAIAGYQPLLEDSSGGTQNAFIGTAGATDESISIFLRDSMIGATGTITVTQAASDPWAGRQVSLLVKPLNAPLPIALRLPFFLPRRAA